MTPEEKEFRDHLQNCVKEMQAVSEKMREYFKKGEQPPEELRQELDVIGEKLEAAQQRFKGE